MGTQSSKTVVLTAAPSPGQRLLDLLAEKGLKQVELARLLGRTPQYVQDVTKGKKAMDARVAVELEEALGTPSASQWLLWELDYQKAQMQLEQDGKVDRSIKRKDVVEEYPFVLDAVKYGWIEDSRDAAVLKANTEAYLSQADRLGFRNQYNFRRSGAFQTAGNSLDAWSIQCFLLARQSDQVAPLPLFRREEIEPVLVPRLQQMMRDEGAVAGVQALLAEFGIRFMIVPNLKKAPVDGMASLNVGADGVARPFMAMTLRHGQLDRFWFVLMHELAHLHFNHHEQPEAIEFGNFDSRVPNSLHEIQADQQASHWLIPDEAFHRLINSATSIDSIRRFAAEIGRHPAIALGRLKREGYVPWTLHAREHVSVREALTKNTH